MVVGEEPVNVIEQPKWTQYVAEIKSWVCARVALLLYPTELRDSALIAFVNTKQILN